MPFDVLEFIPSPEVREECKRFGRTFDTREKAAIVSRSDRPMKDRLDAYLAIGEEDNVNRKTLTTVTDWMSGKLESFTNAEDGYVFFSGRRSVFIGYLDSCVSTAFIPILERCKECVNTDKKIMITKAAVDRNYYQTAFIDLSGEIIRISEFNSKHKKGYDPEKRFNTYLPDIPCPFKKGDAVCYDFESDSPMVFLKQEEQQRFQYIGEDYLTGRLFTNSAVLRNRLIYYKDEIPYGELRIAQKAVLGEVDFVDGLNLIQRYRCEMELNEIDEGFEQDNGKR